MRGEGAAEAPHRLLPAVAGRQSAGDGILARTAVALLGAGEEREQLVESKRPFRLSAKVALVTRQTLSPRCFFTAVL